MKKRHLGFAIVLLMLVAGAAVLYAQSERGQGQRRHHGQDGFFGLLSSGKLQERLKLSSDQMARIREISSGQKMKFFELSSTTAQKRQALAKEIFSDKPNQSEIEKRMDALNTVHVAQMQQLVSTAVEINKVLTPEQRTEFQRVIDEQVQRGLDRREKFRERLMKHNAPPSPSAPAER